MGTDTSAQGLDDFHATYQPPIDPPGHHGRHRWFINFGYGIRPSVRVRTKNKLMTGYAAGSGGSL